MGPLTSEADVYTFVQIGVGVLGVTIAVLSEGVWGSAG